ncbi:MAG: sulfite exporter TauE/SafE family protein [Planctomycetaceae bacterium]|nr:sulfite exporter TauE/SafE family protein [Planctomycetaceae bacterium]
MGIMILGALLIGLTLGLMGSGGSILTVPVLVYVLGHHGKVAIAESLAIVGGIAMVGLIPYARARLIDWHSVAYFGIPGMAGTWLGAWIANFVPASIQLVLFAIVMLGAAVMMFRGRVAPSVESHQRQALWKIVPEGLLVGIITGLVGVGGGFLIVPALVILGGLPMRSAVGTSLVIICLKSLSGFIKYMGVLAAVHATIDTRTVVLFVVLGIIGSMMGQAINQHLDQRLLKKTFAVFLVMMGVFVLTKELPHLANASPGSAVAGQASHG